MTVFDRKAFDRAKKCFLQFEYTQGFFRGMPRNDVVCNASPDGLEAFLNYLKRIEKKEGRYDLPQWQYVPWTWKTMGIGRSMTNGGPIPYFAIETFQSYTEMNKIASKVYLDIIKHESCRHLRLYRKEDNIHIEVSQEGLILFEKLLSTSKNERNWFFVIKSHKNDAKRLTKSDVCLDGTWDDGSFDIFEFVCLNTNMKPWVELNSNTIKTSSCGYLWLIETIDDYVRSNQNMTSHCVPIKPFNRKTYKIDFEYEKECFSRISKRDGFCINYLGSTDPIGWYATCNDHETSSSELILSNLSTSIESPVITYDLDGQKCIIRANQKGWNEVLMLFDTLVRDLDDREHLSVYQYQEIIEFERENKKKPKISYFGPKLYSGLYFDVAFHPRNYRDTEPCTGLLIEDTSKGAISSFNYNVLFTI